MANLTSSHLLAACSLACHRGDDGALYNLLTMLASRPGEHVWAGYASQLESSATHGALVATVSLLRLVIDVLGQPSTCGSFVAVVVARRTSLWRRGNLRSALQAFWEIFVEHACHESASKHRKTQLVRILLCPSAKRRANHIEP